LKTNRLSFRAPKRTTIALLTAGGIFLWGCSKTQDTAPETRIFGSPPIINSVSLNATGAGTATCDFTLPLQGFLCTAGGYPPSVFVSFPTVSVVVTYTEAAFSVNVTDAESKPTASDILLVSASYKTTAGTKPTEISLVILDDGSSNKFAYNQVGTVAEDCSSGACACRGAVYQLTSNDVTAGDNVFTRGFAVVSNNIVLTSPTGFAVGATDVARNCIANGNKQFPAFVDLKSGGIIPFKIEAVDKEGNLTTWPSQPTVTLDQTKFTCSASDGDDCACCLLLASVPTDCHGRAGLIGVPGSGFENGLCKDIF
jgi:hypothetical protein